MIADTHCPNAMGVGWAEGPVAVAHQVMRVFDEAQLRRVLKNYASYYNQVRTHLSLDKNAPDFRRPHKLGPIAAIPILGGLHHKHIRVLTRDRCS